MSIQRPTRHRLRDMRLRKHADYQRAYASARKYSSPSMSWFLAPQPRLSTVGETISDPTKATDVNKSDVNKNDDPRNLPHAPRVGLTVGKVIGPAHERNRIKRRMRELLRLHAELLPVGFDLILHPRRSVLKMEFAKLESELVRILSQARAATRREQNVAGPVSAVSKRPAQSTPKSSPKSSPPPSPQSSE